MTREEFNRWRTDFTGTFPAIGAWLRSLESEEAIRIQVNRWFSALEDRHLEDCLAVTAMLFRGDSGSVGNFPSDWQLLPGRIRRMAGELEFERENRKLKALEAEAMAENGEARYWCKECHDTGRIFVASPEAVRAAVAGLPYAPRLFGQGCVARCNSCSKGLPRLPTPADAPEGTLPKNTHPTPIYDPKKHFAVPWDHLDSEETWDRLLLWVMDRKNDRRVGAFDQFNQGVGNARMS